MAIDVFTENRIEAAYKLASIRNAKLHWGRALVRTDINETELDFLARSFKGCVSQEQVAAKQYRDTTNVVRALSRH